MSIPKKIWMYWAQGEAEAPFLVQQCLLSWRVFNPDWEITVLDKTSLPGYVDLEGFDTREDIGLQALTDIVRVKLLTQLGGVWADATLFCCQPLDQWLPTHVSDHFFAFASERKDRLMTTWFLAGTQDSQLLSAWTEVILDYWRTHRFRRPDLYWTRQVLRKLTSLRKRHIISNDAWFSVLVAKRLRIYPYPVNMYLFERALDQHAELKDAWFSRKLLYDAPAEHLQNNLKMNQPATEESIQFITAMETPVHKLNWRQDLGYAEKGSNLERLIQHYLHS